MNQNVIHSSKSNPSTRPTLQSESLRAIAALLGIDSPLTELQKQGLRELLSETRQVEAPAPVQPTTAATSEYYCGQCMKSVPENVPCPNCSQTARPTATNSEMGFGSASSAQPTTVVHVPVPEGNESRYVEVLREQSQAAPLRNEPANENAGPAKVLTAVDIERIGKEATKDVTCERCGTGGPIMRCGGSRNGCGCKCHQSQATQPVASPTREHGWLIERYCGDPTGKPIYLRLLSYSNESAKPIWVEDSNTALRLARQEDAAEVAKLFPQMCCLAKITEHIWIGVEDVTTR